VKWLSAALASAVFYAMGIGLALPAIARASKQSAFAEFASKKPYPVNILLGYDDKGLLKKSFVRPTAAIELFKRAKLVNPEMYASFQQTAEQWGFTSVYLQEDVLKQRTLQLLQSELGADDLGKLTKSQLNKRSFDSFISRFREVVRPDLSTNQIRLIYDQNMITAYNASQWAALQAPEVRDEVVALRYWAILDERTTETCAALHGSIHPVDSPFWDRNYPPNHFNCRSDVEPIYRFDPEGQQILGGEVPVATAADARAMRKGEENAGEGKLFLRDPRYIKPVHETKEGVAYDFNVNPGAKLLAVRDGTTPIQELVR